MGNTLIIELKTEKARNLIQDLEDLNIITIIKESVTKKNKISEKFKGFLSQNQGEELKQHIIKSRQQWDNI